MNRSIRFHGWAAAAAVTATALHGAGDASVVQLVAAASRSLAASNLVEAAAAARQATVQDPAWAPAWEQFGAVQLQQGDAEAAAASYARATELTPASGRAWRGLAAARWRAGQRERALRALAEYCRLAPDDAGAWLDMAAWMQQQGRSAEAEPLLERVIAMDRDSGRAWRELGLLRLAAGQGAAAVPALEQAARLLPRDAAIRRDLGWCLWTQGRRSDGVIRLTEAVRLGVAGADRVVMQVVGRLAEEGAVPEALAFMRDTGRGTSAGALGMALVRAGRLQAAAPLLAAAWAAGEKQPETGLHLAYVEAVNGRWQALGEQLSPFLKRAAAAPVEQRDMALETLRMASSAADAPALLDQLEAAMKGSQEGPSPAITAILEKAAEEHRARGQRPKAVALYRRVLERDANAVAGWFPAYLLIEREEGRSAAEAWLSQVGTRTTDPAMATGIRGVTADRRGAPAAAAAALAESIRLRPDQPDLRKMLFANSLAVGDMATATAQIDWFRSQVAEGRAPLRSYLAEVLTDAGRDREALSEWQLLRLAQPDRLSYTIENAAALHRLGRPDEAAALLNPMAAAGTAGESRLYELLAEVAGSQALHAEAARWAEAGLAAAPSQALRRQHAESLELLGTNRTAALASAQAFLEIDPHHAPMALLAGRMLVALNRPDEAAAHYAALAGRSPGLVPAVTAMRDLAAASGKTRAAVTWSRKLAELQPHDAETRRRLASSLAQDGRPADALRILRRLADAPLSDAVPILVYAEITPHAYAGRTSVHQVTRHVQRLADEGYRFVGNAEDVLRRDQRRRVMVVLVDPDEQVMVALRPVLAQHGATVVIASPLKLPDWRGRNAGDEASYADRAAAAVAAAAVPPDAADRIVMYPGGDYGQRSLDVEPAAVAALRAAVAARYRRALCWDDSGFCLPDTDPLRMPGRRVPAAWDAEALSRHLRHGHPLVRSRLELAKVLYWNQQHEEANRWFAQARTDGANPAELEFNWGANANMQGDLPQALAHLQAAQQLDPGEARVDQALEAASARRRPTAELFTRHWSDNEDRAYSQYGASAEAGVTDAVRVGAFADRNRWRADGAGSETGDRIGISGLAFLLPQVWTEGRIWHLDHETPSDLWGGALSLHGPNPFASGHVDVFASRDEIETVEAVRESIRANRYGLATYTRMVDVLDLYVNLARVERSDQNDSALADGRLLYRVSEWPHVGAGWRFRYGDSDEDPAAYWAPERLQQHQAHANVRGSWGRMRGSISGEAGYATEEGTDWRFVWGGRADASLMLTDRVSVNGQFMWHEGPEYERLTWAAGLRGRF